MAVDDPTPRTAATARDALALALHEAKWQPAMDGKSLAKCLFARESFAHKMDHDAQADAILAALPDDLLATAEAPGRVAALEGDRGACPRCGIGRHPASGIPDKRCTHGGPANWCDEHGWESAPAGVSGERHPVKPGPYRAGPQTVGFELPIAPAPTPSEPVER